MTDANKFSPHTPLGAAQLQIEIEPQNNITPDGVPVGPSHIST